MQDLDEDQKAALLTASLGLDREVVKVQAEVMKSMHPLYRLIWERLDQIDELDDKLKMAACLRAVSAAVHGALLSFVSATVPPGPAYGLRMLSMFERMDNEGKDGALVFNQKWLRDAMGKDGLSFPDAVQEAARPSPEGSGASEQDANCPADQVPL